MRPLHPPFPNRALRPPLLAIGAAALVLASGLLYVAATNADDDAQLATTGTVPAANSPVWHDEFDGAAQTSPDRSKWVFEAGNIPWGDGVDVRGWGNDELQYYTDSTRNAALDGNGNLVITARRERPANSRCWYGACQYTSTRIKTAGTFSQKYGRFEARIKMPAGGGLLPAFWMLSDTNKWPDGGEIDIVEYIAQEPKTAQATVHGPGYAGQRDLSFDYSPKDGSAIPDDFHVYAIDWEPNRIAWSVDGQEYGFVTPETVKPGKWVFNDSKFHILLNLAVGGEWPGKPAASVPFPQNMIIDYVRAYATPGIP